MSAWTSLGSRFWVPLWRAISGWRLVSGTATSLPDSRRVRCVEFSLRMTLRPLAPTTTRTSAATVSAGQSARRSQPQAWYTVLITTDPSEKGAAIPERAIVAVCYRGSIVFAERNDCKGGPAGSPWPPSSAPAAGALITPALFSQPPPRPPGEEGEGPVVAGFRPLLSWRMGPHLGHPPVHHQHLAEGPHHHVLRLEVPVDDAVGMGESHGFTDALEGAEPLGQG